MTYKAAMAWIKRHEADSNRTAAIMLRALVASTIERCAQEAETAYGLPAVNGDGGAEAARRIRALRGAK